MDREHWAELSWAISSVQQTWTERRMLHPTSRIVRVYLWAAIHNCTVSWACEAGNWDARTAPISCPANPP